VTGRETFAREDLRLGTDEPPSPPTSVYASVTGGDWHQKLLASALVGTIALAPVTATGLDYFVPSEERPTHSALLGGLQEEVVQVVSPPRKIDLAEAIRLANVNYQRVEKLLDREVERDALGTAVWEEE